MRKMGSWLESAECNGILAIVKRRAIHCHAANDFHQKWLRPFVLWWPTPGKPTSGAIFPRGGMLRYNTPCYSEELSKATNLL
ncbi:MAG: hypothetical protein ACJ8LG_23640, partial [Massilia sp.]